MNIDASADLIVRALVTRIEYLEEQLSDSETSRMGADEEIEKIAAYLFEGEDPLVWAEAGATTIIDELKRRGCKGRASA